MDTPISDHKPVRRIRRGPEEWRDIIARFEQSGQTRHQFCAKHGLGLSTFTRWRKRLRREDPSPPASGDRSLFVELAQAVPVEIATAWDVELELGAGTVLRLRRCGC